MQTMDHPEFLTAKELASRLGLEVATFNRMVAIGDLPHGIDITGKGRTAAATTPLSTFLATSYVATRKTAGGISPESTSGRNL
jgi:hypothetical protein